MKIAYILFDGITWLDFIGAYHPISQLQKLGYLPNLTWQTAASSIDLGLYVCTKLAGKEVADIIRLKMDFGERIKV